MRFLSFLAAFVLLTACSPKRVEGTEPGDCTDDADNDADGLFDCDDPDCAGASVCEDADDDTGTDTDTAEEADAYVEGSWTAVDAEYHKDECGVHVEHDGLTLAPLLENYQMSNFSDEGFDLQGAFGTRGCFIESNSDYSCSKNTTRLDAAQEAEVLYTSDISGKFWASDRGFLWLDFRLQCEGPGCDELFENVEIDLPCDVVLEVELRAEPTE